MSVTRVVRLPSWFTSELHSSGMLHNLN